jgi:Lrp/AsnC family leucine-responsive transcriptional regulator
LAILKHAEWLAGAYEVDDVDKLVLAGYMKDASLSYKELGEVTGLPPSTVFDRVKRLRKEGIIVSVVPILDTQKLGLNTIAFLQIKMSTVGDCCEVADRIAALPEVLEVHEIAGPLDILAKVKVRDNLDLHNVGSVISKITGIEDVNSTVTVRTIKEDIPPKL